MPFLDELSIDLCDGGKRGWMLGKRFRYRTRCGICIVVPRGFPTDGASIPRVCWRVIGDPMCTDYVEPAIVHDFLWRKALAGRCTFRFANRIFREALAESFAELAEKATTRLMAKRAVFWKLRIAVYRAHLFSRRWLMWAAVSLNAVRIILLGRHRQRPQAIYSEETMSRLTQSESGPLLILAIILALAVLLALTVDRCNGQQLDTSGWRASASTFHLKPQYGTGYCTRDGRCVGMSGGLGLSVGGNLGICGSCNRPTPAVNRASQLQKSTVKVGCTLEGRQAWGSGSLIAIDDSRSGGRYGLILTCAHTFQAGWESVVEFQDVYKVPSKIELIGNDATHDIAVLELVNISRPSHVLPLAAGDIAVGQSVQWEGFAGGSQPYVQSGRVSSVSAHSLRVPGQAPNGTSGGPIYSTQGLQSIITQVDNATGRWEVSGPPISWIRPWLISLGIQIDGTDYRRDGLVAIEPPPTESQPTPSEVQSFDSPTLDYCALAHALIEAGVAFKIADAMPDPVLPGPGPQGEQGPVGPPGTITLIVVNPENKELFRRERIVSGSKVRLNFSVEGNE